MTSQRSQPTRIDRLLTGEPLTIGACAIRPAARVSGWAGGQRNWGGGWLQVQPVEVIVRAADGSERRAPIADGNAQALRGIVAAGLTVAVVCAALIALRTMTPHTK